MILTCILAVVLLGAFNKLKAYNSHTQYYSINEYFLVSLAVRLSERAFIVSLLPALPLLLASLWKFYDEPYKATIGIVVTCLIYVLGVFILRKIGE